MYKLDEYTTLKIEKSLKTSQFKRLSVNSITIDYSFWVKIGQTFLILFIGSNRVIVCSECSLVRIDVYLFVQDSPYFSSGPCRSVPTRFC